MATFSSFEAFNRELERMARDVEKEARSRIAMDMAKAGQKIAEREARKDLGGDDQFSGWPNRYLDDLQVKRLGRGGALLAPTRKSGGPWKVAEQGRNQGGALGRGGVAIFHGPGISRKTGESLIRYNKNGSMRKLRARTAGARWSGKTAGKRTASRAQVVMERELPKIAEREVRRVMVRHFDVT